ncbi:SCO family protein [Balneolaceae bacterium ANBcel3]|nr:SCO family protein [Balneolaceae bacterium ANBcel3]
MKPLFLPETLIPRSFLLLVFFLWNTPAFSQHNIPPDQLKDVGVTEKLGETVDLSIRLTNEEGEEVTLGDYLNNGKPVILAMVYYECPMLCNLILQGLMRGIRDISWTPGVEFEVLAVSINPDETPEIARNHKQGYLEQIADPEAVHGIHFLTGEENDVRRLGDQVGFYYAWNEQTQEYMHGSTLIFLSPEGRISRYLHGIDYPGLMIRNALFDAADGRIGSSLDRIVLYCFQYDAASGSYVPVAMNIMKIGGIVSVLFLGLFLGFFFFREHRKNAK